MNSKEILEKFTCSPEDFVRHLQDPDYYNVDWTLLNFLFGDIEIVNREEERADEHVRESWDYRKGSIVLFFKNHGVYLKTDWYQGSYETESYSDWKEVFPKTKIIYE